MTKSTIDNLINLRGLRQQMMFATSRYTDPATVNGETRIFLYKGMRGCYTKGCEIFTPAMHWIKGVDLQEAIRIEKIYNGEEPKPSQMQTPEQLNEIIVAHIEDATFVAKTLSEQPNAEFHPMSDPTGDVVLAINDLLSTLGMTPEQFVNELNERGR